MLDWLANDLDPLVRYKFKLTVLGEDPGTDTMRRLAEEVKESPRVQALLSDRGEDGRIPWHPYAKWQGAHWVLTCLADSGYPPGDEQLVPLREQVFGWLLSDEHQHSIERQTGKKRQVRLHASMEANALFAMLALGLADERLEALVARLLWAQWEDGGWNCDRRENADSSSFHESITPVRALARYAQMTGDRRVRAASEHAVEIFLRRQMFRRIGIAQSCGLNFYACVFHLIGIMIF